MQKKILSLLLLLSPLSGTAGINEVLECKSIKNNYNRLLCYDAALEKLNIPTTKTKDNDSISNNASSKQKEFGQDSLERSSDKTEALVAAVTSFETDKHGRTIFTLDNGQVWKQTERKRLNLSSRYDYNVNIQVGIFGKYRMALKINKRTIHSVPVKRVE